MKYKVTFLELNQQFNPEAICRFAEFSDLSKWVEAKGTTSPDRIIKIEEIGKDLTSDEKLEAIYDKEKNVRIESFWDGGWTFFPGDRVNGFSECKTFEKFSDGVDWLYELVCSKTK